MQKKSPKVPYDPKTIEAKWQAKWQETGIYQPDLEIAKRPFYNLMMFPYPSAEGLHVGSFFTYGGIDAYGRFKRLQGYTVFEPIGLDGFGIHSENYALKVGRTPQEHAKISEKNFYRQLHALGNMFDWSRKLETYDPDYYKWTQWLFTELFKAGFAYKAMAKVNFCPSCKTVLADEQVITKIKDQRSKIKDSNEEQKVSVKVCERCETEVEMKNLAQWFFRITEYAERLLGNLETLDWSQKVKVAQKNWIGKSEGAKISFNVILNDSEGSEKHREDSSPAKRGQNDIRLSIEVFTTRPDTLYGATFMVVAPEHPLIQSILDERSKIKDQRSKIEEVKAYVESATKKSETERTEEKDPSAGSGQGKTGVFTGLYVTNPVSGEKMPVWVADYVLMGYGTGAIMAVPAHDERDFEFARKYGLPVKQVISPIRHPEQREGSHVGLPPKRDSSSSPQNDMQEEAYTGVGVLTNSGDWDGWEMPREMGKVLDWLEKKGIGERMATYHLRDWLISRQRYWAAPIPMIHCAACAKEGKSWFTQCHSERSEESHGSKRSFANTQDDMDGAMAGWYPVPTEDLPVLLPEIENYRPLGTGKAPLASYPDFYETTCPVCGGTAIRETDVCDTFLDSSWYFLRYLATDWPEMPFPSLKYLSEHSEDSVGQRVRKSDHLKLRYSEFSEKVKSRGQWLPVTSYIGGAEHSVLHLLYARFVTMVLHDLGYLDFEEPFTRFRHNGLIIKDGAKMSKSRGNVINPDEYVNKFGADTLRMYLAFVGPFSDGGDFRDTGIEGMGRFLKRVWTMLAGQKISSIAPADSAKRLLHQTVAGVTADMEELRFNTAIAKLMTYYNGVSKQETLTMEEAKAFVQMLAPFAPHMAEELWELLGEQYSVHNSHWPEFDKQYLVEDVVTVVVQINGKMRASFQDQRANLPAGRQGLNAQKYVEGKARKLGKVQKYLEGKEVKKVIYVPGKIINFVT